MTEALKILVALAAGAAFGAVYFGLLARAARGIAEASAGAMLLSFAARMALALAAIGAAIWAGAGAAELLAAALGFTVARQVAVRRAAREG